MRMRLEIIKATTQPQILNFTNSFFPYFCLRSQILSFACSHECSSGEKDARNAGQSNKETDSYGETIKQAAVSIPAGHLSRGKTDMVD